MIYENNTIQYKTIQNRNATPYDVLTQIKKEQRYNVAPFVLFFAFVFVFAQLLNNLIHIRAQACHQYTLYNRRKDR